MPSKSKPKDSDEVYEVMKAYCKEKKFNFSDTSLRYMAEDSYLLFESRNWKGISYWPAVAKRWILNNISKQSGATSNQRGPTDRSIKPKGKTVRDIILENNKDDIS